MVDADSLVPGDAILELALALNQGMRKDAAARARYLAIYGVAWEPLGTADGSAYFPSDVVDDTDDSAITRPL